MAEPYGQDLVERAYLSRLHAMLVNSGYRGQFAGVEPVDRLFALLRRSDRGTKLADQFVSVFGDGGKRTSVATIRIADERAYQAWGLPNVWPTRHTAVMALPKRLIKDIKENREEWRARRFERFLQPIDAIVPVDQNHPSPADINAAALRIAAQVDARHKKGVHQMAKRKTPQKTDKKYDRFVMDVREIGDPATSPSQAEINASVEINLRKQALAIFAKAEKAKTKGRKLTADDKQTYDHFAKQYPHLVTERRAEFQKQLERFIQPAEGIRPNGVGPSPAEVDEAARRALENYKRSGKKSS